LLANADGVIEPSEEPTGAVALIFTRPAKGVTVAVDGQLVVERIHTDSVRIEGLTAGIAELRVAAGSGPARLEAEMRVDVEVGRTTTVPLGAPSSEESSGYLNAALSVAAIVLSTALTNWLF